MPTRHVTLRAQVSDAGQRLDEVVHRLLEQALGRRLSRSAIRRLIMAGAVRKGGFPFRRPGALIGAGLVLHVAVDEDRFGASGIEGEGASSALQVLYEDESVIAVAKPAGLQVHASADSSRADLFTLVRQYLRGRGGAYLGLHHRLDRDTSGLVLFAKAETANAGLARQFERREVEKVYHAVTVGTARGAGGTPLRGVRTAWRLENRLALVGKGRHARMASVDGDEGQAAVTTFRVLRVLGAALLVEARPETGRKHQIRAHLRESGLPILGDARYGGPPRLGRLQIPRAMLHAWRLSLRHPLTGAPLEMTCGYPPDFRTLLEGIDAQSA